MLGIVGQTQDGACVVHGVEEGSPAARAGLQPQDVIISYNGEKIDGFDRLIEITRELSPGDRIKIDIARRLQEQTVELELADFE
ncbi:MAG: PDZ domain-containing protein [Planctomycetaceae bacterium]|nr:MAG: PDZ domain-containing protein [Planctomycetaceae bacterium]